MTQAAQTTTQGVQVLIDRIRNQGVKAADEEAARIVREAEAKAAKLLAETKAETDRMREQANREIDGDKQAALEALRLSARDAVLHLKSQVASSFEVFLKRLVTSASRDADIIKDLVLVLAGQSVDEFIRDKEIQILISDVLLTGEPDEKLREHGKNMILALSSDMLREGVELIPSAGIEGGARIRLVADQLEIDLSDVAITRLLKQFMLPRFRRILDGIE
jgi:V/A-type H+-transporting ATPase subunit E